MSSESSEMVTSRIVSGSPSPASSMRSSPLSLPPERAEYLPLQIITATASISAAAGNENHRPFIPKIFDMIHAAGMTAAKLSRALSTVA